MFIDPLAILIAYVAVTLLVALGFIKHLRNPENTLSKDTSTPILWMGVILVSLLWPVLFVGVIFGALFGGKVRA